MRSGMTGLLLSRVYVSHGTAMQHDHLLWRRSRATNVESPHQPLLWLMPAVQLASGLGGRAPCTWTPRPVTPVAAGRSPHCKTLRMCAQAASRRPETHVMWKTTTTEGPSYPRDKRPMLEDLHSGALAAVASESASRAVLPQPYVLPDPHLESHALRGVPFSALTAIWNGVYSARPFRPG